LSPYLRLRPTPLGTTVQQILLTVMLDRALAAEVEDNYEKWSEDSRYEAWMTRPEYRNFIGGPQEQRKARNDD
jgi:hypothetical protein